MTYIRRETGMMMVFEEARSILVEFKHTKSKGERLPDDDPWKSQRWRMWARGVCESLVAGNYLPAAWNPSKRSTERQGSGMVSTKDKGSTKPGHLHGCNPSYSRSRSRRISSSKTVWTS